MKHAIAHAVVMLPLLAGLAIAEPKSKGMSAATPARGHCPPGLAKKNPPCVPPGLARKGYLPEGYRHADDWLDDPAEHGLPHPGRNQGYIRIGDVFVKVDKETWEILNLFDALGRVLDDG